jgi:uncharacterized membrane protein YhaH (DUF805 family)
MWKLFFRLQGRIGRLKWWAGTISLFIAMVVMMFVIMFMFFTGSGEISWERDVVTTPGGALINFALLAFFGYMWSALTIKRLNDRDRPHWLLAVCWSPIVIPLLGDLIGLPIMELGAAGMLLHGLLFATSIWMIIELGFLRGMPGPNRHGPDPLASGHPMATQGA